MDILTRGPYFFSKVIHIFKLGRICHFSGTYYGKAHYFTGTICGRLHCSAKNSFRRSLTKGLYLENPIISQVLYVKDFTVLSITDKMSLYLEHSTIIVQLNILTLIQCAKSMLCLNQKISVSLLC